MAPWIVHIRLAERLSEEIADLDPEYFAIGNVAPDSGFREDINQEFNPPSRVSHFFAEKGSQYHIADLEFFRMFLDGKSRDGLRREEYSFLLGYFFHLVTDNLWYQEIDIPIREQFKEEFDADPDFIWEVKRDWYGLDFAYVRSNPESWYWTLFLYVEYEEDFLEFMPKAGIEKRVAEIKEIYQRTDEEIEELYGRRPDKYLSQEEYDAFVERNSQRLLGIHRLLFEGDEVAHDEHQSVLETDR